ncbi:MAG: ester cyclase [Nocardioides sp.]|uniref:ester cyclase n=1 Tax=Nocardioides sp. TaxID=35761 RepID=UPI0039E419F8
MNTAARLAEEVLDVLHNGNVEKLDELVSEDFVDHGAPPWLPPGRATYAATLRWLHDTLRIKYVVHDTVAAGDKVAIRATAHGVHDTEYMGFPPTGKPYTIETMHIYRAQDGVLAEHWGVRDELAMLWQVGALEAPRPSAFIDAAGTPAT